TGRASGGAGDALHRLGDPGAGGIRRPGGRDGHRLRLHGPDPAHLEGHLPRGGRDGPAGSGARTPGPGRRAVPVLHQPADLRRHPAAGGRTAHPGHLGQPGDHVGGVAPIGYPSGGTVSGADRHVGALRARTAGPGVRLRTAGRAGREAAGRLDMTALGFLYPGHSAEDDYPRIEQLLGSDVRVDLVHTDIGEDAHRVDALREMGSPERLAAGVEQLRLTGADAVVWACTSGSFVHGWDGAQQQVRSLAMAAGMPASSTSFAFVHAVREMGASRVAVGATYPDDVAALFSGFLRTGGIEVTGVRSSGIITAAEVGTWGEAELFALARAADHPDAEL